MGTVRTRLAATLAAAWEAEMVAVLTMEKLAEQLPDRHVRSRLVTMSATCQAHASRLLGRLAALGGAPLPVPPDEVELDGDGPAQLRREAARAQFSAERYASMANLARKAVEPAAAWVCELNRQEELDRARELLQLAERAQAGDEPAADEANFLAPPA